MTLIPTERIIVPLDTPDAEIAARLVAELAPLVGAFKVGYELGYALGWDAAAALVHNADGKLFLDAKLNDIPNTVGSGARSLAKHAPQFLTVHASSGEKAIAAAVSESDPSTTVLAVTVLTSLSNEEAEAIFHQDTRQQVCELALRAVQAGAGGIVCSPLELEALRALPELRDVVLVTPGVRPAWALANDQQRVLTPSAAIERGADYLVIGRPITAPPETIGSPRDAAELIAEEIASASIESA